MRIFITGHKGQLGRALCRTLDGHELALADLPETDITDRAAIGDQIAAFRPDLVLHPAALTDTTACQRNPDQAYRVNALGTRNVALGCQRAGAALLYISTNEVFDGQNSQPYLEWERVNPMSAYARSKQAGEWYVQSLLDRYYVVRTAWLYGGATPSFVSKTLEWARSGKEVRVVTDEVATPTYLPDLVSAMVSLTQEPAYGVYHFTNAGQCSRFEWARLILGLAGLGNVDVAPAVMADFPTAIPKPAYSVLRNFCGAELGIALRPWQEALEDYFRASRGGA